MKKRLYIIILTLVFLIGLSVLLYPTVSDYINTKRATKAIYNYETLLKGLEPEDYSAEFAKADEYNAEMRKVTNPFKDYDKVPNYDNILNVAHNGIIGYISIEKIKVELPIYHGISGSVLSSSVGHVPGSSLPVGGASTHSVLSAHRGLPRAQLFTHLDKMEEGDIFTLTVLDRTLTYQVDQILVVEPENMEALDVTDGKDYCTLVTCTPYGINTHRLLVRGTRIEETVSQKSKGYIQNEGYEESKGYISSEGYIVNPMIVALIVAVPMLFTLLTVLMIKYGKRRRKPKSNAENFREKNCPEKN